MIRGSDRSHWIDGLSLFIVGVFTVQATRLALARPLWFDEIFSVSSSRYLGWADWFALPLENGDFQPPWHYVVTAAGMGVFPESELGPRLPQLLGLLCCFLFVYLHLANRLAKAWGLLAVVGLLIHLYYAAEARPYGQLLGATSALVWARMKANDSDAWYWHAAIAGALCWALMTHVYAVLLAVPLLAAEGTRALLRKQLDLRRVAWLAIAIPPALMLLPIVEYASTFASGYWATLDARDPLEATSLAAFGRDYVLFAYWVCVLAGPLALFGRDAELERPRSRLPHDELVLLLGLATLPLLGAAIAAIGNGVYTPRHFLFAAVGLQPLLAYGAYHAARGRRWVAIGASFLLLVPVLVHSEEELSLAHRERREIVAYLDLLSQIDPALPVVSSQPLSFLPLWYYADGDLRERMSLLVDLEDRRRRFGSDTTGRSVMDLAGKLGISILPPDFNFAGQFVLVRDDAEIRRAAAGGCRPASEPSRLPIFLCDVPKVLSGHPSPPPNPLTPTGSS